MASTRHNADFANHLFPSDPLDTAIDWIKANLAPSDVLGKLSLVEHVRNNIEIDDVYPERNILDFVQGTYNPGDVFTDRDLEGWADDHGYTKQ